MPPPALFTPEKPAWQLCFQLTFVHLIALPVYPNPCGCALPSNPGQLEIRVEDRGIGVSADQIEQIFYPFGQVEQSRTRTYEGTGLGLTISRSLVELNGGQLQFESEFGQGTCVSFTIPSEPEAAARRLDRVPAPR